MAKVQFIGRVLPTTQMVNIAAKDLSLVNHELNVSISIKVRIANSIINLECEYNDETPIAEVYGRAYAIARASLSMASFATGKGLWLIMEIAIHEDGVPMLINWEDQNLTPLCTAFAIGDNLTPTYDKVHELIVGTPQLFLAMSDLISSLYLPNVPAVSCGRAMDGIKHLLSEPGMRDVAAWKNLRRLLNIEENYLKLITDASAGPRHGRIDATPTETIMEIKRRAWRVMDRCLIYLLTKHPLEGPAYPELK